MSGKVLRGLLFLSIIFASVFVVGAQEPDLSLSEVYISIKGDYILRYPSEWRVQETQDNLVILRRAPDEVFSVGLMDDHTLEASVSLDEMLSGMTDDGSTVAGPIRRLILNGHMAAAAEFSYVDDPYLKGDAFAITINGLTFRSLLYTPAETRDEVVEVALAMLGSLQTPRQFPAGSVTDSNNPTLPQRFTTENNALTFDFPADWHVLEWLFDDHERIYVYGTSPVAGFVEVMVEMSEDTSQTLVDYLAVGSLNSTFARDTVDRLELNGYETLRYETVDPLLYFQDGLFLGTDFGAAYVRISTTLDALADPAIEPLLMQMLKTVSLNGVAQSNDRRRSLSLEERITQVELTERYESDDGRLSFSYPAGWRVRISGSDLILISNADGYQLNVVPVQGGSVRDVLNNYYLEESEENAVTESPQFLIDDRLMGYTLVDIPNEPLEMFYLADVDGTLVYIIAEFDERDPVMDATLMAILASAEAVPVPNVGTLSPGDGPNEPQTYTSATERLAFQVPPGWQVQERQQGPGLQFLLVPPESEGPMTPVAFDFYAEEQSSIEDLAMMSYLDIIHDSVDTTHLQIAGHKAIRVDMQNDELNYARTLTLVVDLENGNILLVRFLGSELAEFDWESLFMSLFESVQLLDGSASAAPADDVAAGDTAADVSCTITAPSNVNLRGGPGTQFDIAGSLAAGATAQADHQASGGDGFVWWQLTSGYWVRSDVVTESGDCDGLPAAA